MFVYLGLHRGRRCYLRQVICLLLDAVIFFAFFFLWLSLETTNGEVDSRGLLWKQSANIANALASSPPESFPSGGQSDSSAQLLSGDRVRSSSTWLLCLSCSGRILTVTAEAESWLPCVPVPSSRGLESA